jgi:hypothetical protein
MYPIDKAIARIAAEQHGAFSLRQIVSLGGDRWLAARRVDRGVWDRARPGVYTINGVPRTFHQRVMVAVLAAGDGALASHRTAARLWGVSGRVAVPVEVTIPTGRSFTMRGVEVHRSRDLDLASATQRDGIPITGLARTVLDIASIEPHRLAATAWEAMRSGGLTWDELEDTVGTHARRGRSGVRAARDLALLRHGTAPGDSRTEDRAYEILVSSNRVPLPDRLVPVVCADGVEVVVDLAWPRYGLLLEIHGDAHFLDERTIQIDLLRSNQLTLAGYELMTYSGAMLRRPGTLVDEVVARLGRRGWDGSLAA